MIAEPLSLWHIANDTQKLLANLFDNETGEINMEVQAQLDALETNSEQRMIAIGSWIEKMKAERREIEFMEQQLENRRAAYDKEIGKWHKHLMDNMQRCNITEVSSPLFTIRLKQNPYSTDVTDMTQLPEKYIKRTTKMVQSVTPDKNLIKADFLATMKPIPGAIVQRTLKLEILTDKI